MLFGLKICILSAVIAGMPIAIILLGMYHPSMLIAFAVYAVCVTVLYCTSHKKG